MQCVSLRNSGSAFQQMTEVIRAICNAPASIKRSSSFFLTACEDYSNCLVEKRVRRKIFITHILTLLCLRQSQQLCFWTCVQPTTLSQSSEELLTYKKLDLTLQPARLYISSYIISCGGGACLHIGQCRQRLHHIFFKVNYLCWKLLQFLIFSLLS